MSGDHGSKYRVEVFGSGRQDWFVEPQSCLRSAYLNLWHRSLSPHDAMDNRIFRLSGGVKRDPAVEAWFSEDPEELQSIAQTWFARMRQCGDDVRELIHDGCPVACVQDAAFGYVDSFTSHVNVGFYHGAMLEDPAGVLTGSGKRMRHVKLAPGREVNAVALGDLIEAAYLDIRARLGAERSSPKA